MDTSNFPSDLFAKMDRDDLRDDNECKGTKPATKIEFGTEDVGKYLCFIRDGMR
jgi:hypothetical protein